MLGYTGFTKSLDLHSLVLDCKYFLKDLSSPDEDKCSHLTIHRFSPYWSRLISFLLRDALDY